MPPKKTASAATFTTPGGVVIHNPKPFWYETVRQTKKGESRTKHWMLTGKTSEGKGKSTIVKEEDAVRYGKPEHKITKQRVKKSCQEKFDECEAKKAAKKKKAKTPKKKAAKKSSPKPVEEEEVAESEAEAVESEAGEGEGEAWVESEAEEAPKKKTPKKKTPKKKTPKKTAKKKTPKKTPKKSKK